MGQTAFPYTAVRGLPAKTLAANNTASAGPLGTVSWAAASTGDVLTVQGDGTVAFAAVSAGIGGSTGSVDNAILRADGTGGSTLQASGWIIADNYTSSPNATVNHASIQATGGTTNVSVSIVPKGSGAFSLRVPDGTATGGNARGANAVDLQTNRNAATQVASGAGSAIFGGQQNTATGTNSCAGGVNSQANGSSSFAYGHGSVSSGNVSFATNASTASGICAFSAGMASVANRPSQFAHSSGRHSVAGDAQFILLTGGTKTTGTTAASVRLSSVSSVDGSGNWQSANAKGIAIASGRILHVTVQILGSKSDGTAVASYMRQVTIKNVGGTTSLVGTVNTIGTDEAAGTSIAITADNTNDVLDISVTGIAAETWRWVAVIHGVELAYGT